MSERRHPARAGALLVMASAIGAAACATPRAREDSPPLPFTWPADRYEVLGQARSRTVLLGRTNYEQDVTIRDPRGQMLRRLSIKVTRQPQAEQHESIAPRQVMVRATYLQEIAIGEKGQAATWRAAGEVRTAKLQEEYSPGTWVDWPLEERWNVQVWQGARASGTLTGGFWSYVLSVDGKEQRLYVQDPHLRYWLLEGGRVVAYARRTAAVEPHFELQVRRELSDEERERTLTGFIALSTLQETL